MSLELDASRFAIVKNTGYFVEWVEMVISLTGGSPAVAPLAIAALAPQPQPTDAPRASFSEAMKALCDNVNSLAGGSAATIEDRVGGITENGVQRDMLVHVVTYHHGAIKVVLEACENPMASRAYLSIPDDLLHRVRR
jgi:hypothetical protein